MTAQAGCAALARLDGVAHDEIRTMDERALRLIDERIGEAERLTLIVTAQALVLSMALLTHTLVPRRHHAVVAKEGLVVAEERLRHEATQILTRVTARAGLRLQPVVVTRQALLHRREQISVSTIVGHASVARHTLTFERGSFEVRLVRIDDGGARLGRCAHAPEHVVEIVVTRSAAVEIGFGIAVEAHALVAAQTGGTRRLPFPTACFGGEVSPMREAGAQHLLAAEEREERCDHERHDQEPLHRPPPSKRTRMRAVPCTSTSA